MVLEAPPHGDGAQKSSSGTDIFCESQFLTSTRLKQVWRSDRTVFITTVEDVEPYMYEYLKVHVHVVVHVPYETSGDVSYGTKLVLNLVPMCYETAKFRYRTLPTNYRTVR